MPCRTRAKRGYVYLLPKMQQQLEYFKSLCCQCKTFLVFLLVLVKNTNTSAKSIEYASMLSGEVAYTSDIEIRTRYNVQRAT